MNDHEIKILETITSKLDYLFNEGVIFNPADIKTIELCAEQLRMIAYDARINLIHLEKTRGQL